MAEEQNERVSIPTESFKTHILEFFEVLLCTREVEFGQVNSLFVNPSNLKAQNESRYQRVPNEAQKNITAWGEIALQKIWRLLKQRVAVIVCRKDDS